MSTVVPNEPLRRTRLQLIAVFAVFAAPLIIGTLLFLFWKPAKTVNYGALLQPPVPAADTALTTPEGKPVTLAAERGHWLLLTRLDAACARPAGELCVERVDTLRRLRLMQGKHQSRLKRVALVRAPQTLPTTLGADGTVLRIATGGTPLDTLLANGEVILADPRGNLVLRYTAGADPKRITADIDRLLKYSTAG